MDKKLEARIARLEKVMSHKNEDTIYYFSPVIAGNNFALNIYQAAKELRQALNTAKQADENNTDLVVSSRRGSSSKVYEVLSEIESLVNDLQDVSLVDE